MFPNTTKKRIGTEANDNQHNTYFNRGVCKKHVAFPTMTWRELSVRRMKKNYLIIIVIAIFEDAFLFPTTTNLELSGGG